METLYFLEYNRTIVQVTSDRNQAEEWLERDAYHQVTKVDYVGDERKKIAYIDDMDLQDFLGAFMVKDHYRFEKILEQLYCYR